MKKSIENAGTILEEESYYDAFGNNVKTVDANGNETSYVYDFIGRITGVNNPDGTSRAAEYNAKENSVTVNYENGKKLKHDYTAFGNQRAVYGGDLGDKLLVEYKYDGLNRVKSQKALRNGEDSYAEIEYEYDKSGRVVKEIEKDSGTVKDTKTNEYAGTEINYTYDRNNRLLKEESEADGIKRISDY